MEIGIDSFISANTEIQPGVVMKPVDRMRNLLEEIELADSVGLHSFGIGEHHRSEYLDSSPVVILGAAASRTKQIRLTSAVTVLSAADPVRVFQDFATLDLLSQGRAEIIVGRGSSTEAFPLFGFDLHDYDALFTEKLGLLLQLRNETHVKWSGKFRPALMGQGIYPRPLQEEIPIWLGVGGTPGSFERAGRLGLPLMLAIIGGDPRRFRPLIDLYREAGRIAGHPPDKLKVGLHAIGFVGETSEQARNEVYPGYARAFAKIGKERGWPLQNRAQFDAQCEPNGAFLIGGVESVAKKILYLNEMLGGISRINFQMTVAAVPHKDMLRAISILGTRVLPLVEESLGG